MADLTVSVTDAQLTRIKKALAENGVEPDNAGVVTWLNNQLNNSVRLYEEAVAVDSVSGLGL
jgi:hypothetical protein|tara:strand:- start:215 stop:400 length:186 start_codon:yes stop_codon:yes gene_type:complete